MRLIVGLTIALAAATSRLPAQCPDGTPPPCPGARGVAAPPTSVAVLYLDNGAGDTAAAFIADGLTEAVITRLGSTPRLVVKSRTAVQRYRGRALVNPQAVARALGVRHLVTGSVRGAGRRLRITVELVSAATGLRLWGEQYTRAADDLLGIEEDVARSVASAVVGRLLPEERARLGARPTRNREAYSHLLRGNVLLARRTPAATASALVEYQAALRLDPDLVAAWARTALGYELFISWGWTHPVLPLDSVLERGFAAADRAIALDTLSSDAWMARGHLLADREPRTYAGAVPALERAVALDERSAEAWHGLASLLRDHGRLDEAETATRRALDLEPDRAISLLQMGTIAMLRRRYQDALPWLDSAVAVLPDNTQSLAFRAYCRALVGELDGARSDAQRLLRIGRDEAYIGEVTLAYVVAAAGDSLAARARLGALEALLPPAAPLPVRLVGALAPAWLRAGATDRALAVIARAAPRGLLLATYLRAAEYDALRADPRFRAVWDASVPPGTAP